MILKSLDPVFIATKVIVAQDEMIKALQLGQLPAEWALNDYAEYKKRWDLINGG